MITRQMGSLGVTLIAGLSFLLSACSKKNPPPSSSSTQKFICSIQPLAQMVSDLGTPHLTCEALIPKGASAETFDPSPQQLLSFSQAQFFFTVGLPFEETWLPRLQKNYPNLKIANLSESLTHPGADPHLWVSPHTFLKMTQKVSTLLKTHFPEQQETITIHSKDIMEKLTRLHEALSAKAQNIPQKTFISMHPAWAQLAADYHLHEISIEHEGKEPDPQHLQNIAKIVRDKSLKKLFVPLEFKTSATDALAQSLNLTPVYLDIMNPNYLEIGQSFLHELESGF